MSCTFDGSGSSDPDGSVVAWGWVFGNQGSGSGVKPTHDFSNPGTYNVTLIVRDNAGATSSPVTKPVTVPPG